MITEIVALDAIVSRALLSIQSSTADKVFIFFTTLFEPEFLALFFVCLFAVAHYRHKDRLFAVYAAVTALTFSLASVLKQIIGRDRPVHIGDYNFTVAFEPAFPSAHAMVAVVVCGMAAYAAYAYISNSSKYLVIAILGCTALFVGLSRVYLGVHWFTDVLGGWAFGLAIIAAAIVHVRAEIRRTRV